MPVLCLLSCLSQICLLVYSKQTTIQSIGNRLCSGKNLIEDKQMLSSHPSLAADHSPPPIFIMLQSRPKDQEQTTEAL